MGSCYGKKQDEVITIDAVDQQPVGLDVTFTEADVIPSQFVVMVFNREAFASGERGYNLIEKF